MKRATCFLLVVFCLALAQVPPVDASVTKPKTCGCCQVPGACGMPGCCPRPASLPVISSSAPITRATTLVARRRAQPARQAAETFYATFVEQVAGRCPLVASVEPVPAGGVPLFKVHRSFLI